MLCVLLKRKKQKAKPKDVNLKVRWRAKVAMRYCSEESARRATVTVLRCSSSSSIYSQPIREKGGVDPDSCITLYFFFLSRNKKGLARKYSDHGERPLVGYTAPCEALCGVAAHCGGVAFSSRFVQIPRRPWRTVKEAARWRGPGPARHG